ncbi:MAG: proprotein convertase P-domain-containing protein, partial [Phycisphaerales bacterium]|nr:proprotein convertase P-domain-containing protein [Phycisphaerales bacterium]
THPFITDLFIDLTSPSGTVLPLHDGSGFGVQNLVGNYPNSLPFDGGGPSTGPAGDLTDFAGEALDGTWTLDIVDAVPAFSNGVLNSWGLNVRFQP